MERILLVDDDTELCELIAEFLAAEGFFVEAVHNGPRGILRAQSGEHALLILDVMLPGLNGLEVLRRLRAAQSRLPVIMLTARGSDATDRIVGLEMGADDYLPKPFQPRELVARIRAVLRRTQSTEDVRPEREQFALGNIFLDSGTREAQRDGVVLPLTAAEFDVLKVLLRHAGQVVTREALVKNALGRDLSPYDRAIDMHLSNLRKKLGDSGDSIKTIRGVGYLFALPSATPESEIEGEEAAFP
ncbi:MAG: response regulator transcription factor [Armatimonadaceae bacterium]